MTTPRRLCKNCKKFHGLINGVPTCRHRYGDIVFDDPVNTMPCERARASVFYCGPEAAYYEQDHVWPLKIGETFEEDGQRFIVTRIELQGEGAYSATIVRQV